MKRGLVLEGGAMRGLFTAGVIDVMMEHGVCFDGVVGVSAGAAFGCNYKSRQPGRAIRYNKLMARNRRYCSVWSLLLTGDLFGARFVYHYVPTYVDVFDRDTFAANPMEFVVVCTDIVTGEPVYKRLDVADDNALEWIRASASMPMCSRNVRLDGRLLLDGGMADSIPLAYYEGRGYDRNVVILTQPEGYVKEPSRVLPLIRLRYRRYPGIVRVMERRHEMYNAQLRHVAEAEAAGSALVIRPPYALPIGHLSHDPAEMQRVYEIGRTTAEARISEIMNFLEQSNIKTD